MLYILVSVQKTLPPAATKPPRKFPGIPPPIHPCVKLQCESFCCSDSSFQVYSYGSDGGSNRGGVDNGQSIVIIAKNVPSPIGASKLFIFVLQVSALINFYAYFFFVDFRHQRFADKTNKVDEVLKVDSKYHYNVEHSAAEDSVAVGN